MTWGLRDYKLKPMVWGGDPDCKHVFEGIIRHEHRAHGSHGKSRTTDRFYGGDPSRRFNENHQRHFTTRFCHCGAWLGSLGLEPTPELYVQHIVEIFREMWRVLREDGTVWLNMGDCYHSGDRGGYRLDHHRWENSPIQQKRADSGGSGIPMAPNRLPQAGLKDKDLVGMPWRVAFALQADGWYLRSDIIYSKANPMPESVTDRPTRSHEYVFLLTKNGRYYWDQGAVREPHADPRDWRRDFDGGTVGGVDVGMFDGRSRAGNHPAGRNIRSVWTIATQPFPEAHFATFPEALVEPCIKAGSKKGGYVLDPFIGSGTVGRVCRNLGRRFIGLDLSMDYCEMARRRIEAPMNDAQKEQEGMEEAGQEVLPL